jgi:hypothetical protein
MYIIKSDKILKGGKALGKSRIDNRELYHFSSDQDFHKNNPDLSVNDFERVATLESACPKCYANIVKKSWLSDLEYYCTNEDCFNYDHPIV